MVTSDVDEQSGAVLPFPQLRAGSRVGAAGYGDASDRVGLAGSAGGRFSDAGQGRTI